MQLHKLTFIHGSSCYTVLYNTLHDCFTSNYAQHASAYAYINRLGTLSTPSGPPISSLQYISWFSKHINKVSSTCSEVLYWHASIVTNPAHVKWDWAENPSMQPGLSNREVKDVVHVVDHLITINNQSKLSSFEKTVWICKIWFEQPTVNVPLKSGDFWTNLYNTVKETRCIELKLFRIYMEGSTVAITAL